MTVKGGHSPATKLAHHSVHDGDVLALNLIDHHLADAGLAEQIAVRQQEQVSALEGRLHGAGQHDNDRRGRVGDNGEALPHLDARMAKGTSGAAQEVPGRGRN